MMLPLLLCCVVDMSFTVSDIECVINTPGIDNNADILYSLQNGTSVTSAANSVHR